VQHAAFANSVLRRWCERPPDHASASSPPAATLSQASTLWGHSEAGTRRGKLSLVSASIAIYPATSSSEKVRFNTLNRATGNRLKRKMVDAVSEEEVPTEEQVKGYATLRALICNVPEDGLTNEPALSTAAIPSAFEGTWDGLNLMGALLFVTPTRRHWLSHSALMLAARITFDHFSVSSAVSTPKSAGDPASTLPPMKASKS
jgi:hypothetical protein